VQVLVIPGREHAPTGLLAAFGWAGSHSYYLSPG